MTAPTKTSTRLFVALSVPGRVADRLLVARERFPQFSEGVIPTERLHLTLLWLGAADVAAVTEVLTKPLPQTFVPTVRLTHVGIGQKHSQLWAYAEPSNMLRNIREELLNRLPKEIAKPLRSELQEFVPHVTLARLPDVVSTAIADTSLSVSFTASEAALLCSAQKEHGVRYDPVATISFAAATT